MWVFMYLCYALSLLSFGMLSTAFLQNIFGFMVLNANQVTFIILTSIVYLAAETLVIFFFVGTGVSVKEYTAAHGLGPDFHRTSICIKRRVYPPQLLNMLLMMVLFVSMGAVDTGRISDLIYRGFFLLCLAHYIYAKIVQHEAFRMNTENILAMSGLPVPREAQ